MDPLMANCPGAETKSVFSKPRELSFSGIELYVIESPNFIISVEFSILTVSGTFSSILSG